MGRGCWRGEVPGRSGAGRGEGMEFIRPVDWDHAQVNLDGGYQGQYLYAGESCLIIAQ